MLYKENWDESKQRFNALWENEVIDRCCVAVKAPKKGAGSLWNWNAGSARPSSHEALLQYYTDPERVLERHIAEFENTYYAGEALPVLYPSWGDSGFALYFNCCYRYYGNTTWFFPTIANWEKDALVFDENSAILAAHQRFVQFLAKQAEGKFLLSSPDYFGNTDALINLRGAENTLMDMMDEPQRFKLCLKLIGNAVKTVSGSFYDTIIPYCDGGSAIAWYNTWAKGRHGLVQCDFSAMISPGMFEELILPDLEETCNLLDCAVYHLDGQEQLRHLDKILSVKKLKMIQWTNVAGKPSVLNYIQVFQKIQKAGKGLLLFADMKESEKLLSALSPKGLFINAGWASSQEEADEFIKMAAKQAGK
ncbi:MAG: hypothetical protein ABFD25_19650 [Clostridiaceae bacterium]